MLKNIQTTILIIKNPHQQKDANVHDILPMWDIEILSYSCTTTTP
jgi:hypothetical protein